MIFGGSKAPYAERVVIGDEVFGLPKIYEQVKSRDFLVVVGSVEACGRFPITRISWDLKRKFSQNICVKENEYFQSNPHDTISIQSTKQGVNPFELTPYFIWWS